MEGVSVRTESQSDIKAIDVVHLSAFEGDDEVSLIDALRDSTVFSPELSLVAEFHGRIVGHILLSRVRLQRPGSGLDILALAPMAVVPSQSHRGIGSALVNAAIDAARHQRYPAIVVAGHPSFYHRFGFKPASQWSIDCNLPVPIEAVSLLELEEGALNDGGRVFYPSQFSVVY